MKIILKPIISEKSMIAANAEKYTFQVDKSANKHEIAQAIYDFYKVKVKNVNIIRCKPEARLNQKRYKIFTKASKKAIVTLEKGQKIEGFEAK